MGRQEALSTRATVAVIFWLACLVAGFGLVAEIAWQQWNVRDESGITDSATDPRSQREAYLESKVHSLVASFIDARDVRVTVQAENNPDGGEVKSVLVIINLGAPDAKVEQRLTAIIGAGLGLNKQRGDQLSVQFYAFPNRQTSAESVLGLSLMNRVYLAIGMLVFGAFGLMLARHRYRQSIAINTRIEGDYREQLARFKDIVQEEPDRVASVLSEWLNGAPN